MVYILFSGRIYENAGVPNIKKAAAGWDGRLLQHSQSYCIICCSVMIILLTRKNGDIRMYMRYESIYLQTKSYQAIV